MDNKKKVCGRDRIEFLEREIQAAGYRIDNLKAYMEYLESRYEKLYEAESDVELELKKRVSSLETVQKIHTATEFVLAVALLIHIVLHAL